MRSFLLSFITVLSLTVAASAQSVFLEAEGFADTGGWTNDNQSLTRMGSPYLIAHGLGRPVEDAVTSFDARSAGDYRLWVRTRDWTRTWGRTESPGRFQVIVNGKPSDVVFGTESEAWAWQDGGVVKLEKGANQIALHDLTGFDGRCDAIYLTKDLAAEAPEPSASFRRKALGIKVLRRPSTGSGTGMGGSGGGKFDLVVVGGGIAGICAAITAARLGCEVALVQNRPVLGGNNSSEIRVGLSGLIYKEPYPKLGKLMDEIGGVGYWTNWEALRDPDSPRSQRILKVLEEHPEKHIHNAGPASNYEDDKKLEAVLNEPNITLFLNKQVISAKTRGGRIRSVIAKDISTSEEILLKGRLFADCTGDANLGFLAGADWKMGRESKAETGETQAPDEPDGLTMGTSVQWYASDVDPADTSTGSGTGFPECPWAIQFTDSTCVPIVHGEWDWETGLGRDQIDEIERIRDHGLRAVYGNWAFLKNHYEHKEEFENKRLEWVAAIGGKRESRRLMGDVVLKEQDITEGVDYEDASFTATWGMDLHYPKPEPGLESEEPFRAISETKVHKDYAVPYRCLYSRNISNLFMAGRDISVTHAVLGTVRVMRTGGMMGEVVGMAASICRNHKCFPRGVYQSYLDELKTLMKAGAPASPAAVSAIVRPDKVQLDWAEAEMGVLLHLDMPVFHPEYNHRNYGTHPDPSTFNPTELDTDQWIKTAAKLGANYAVLTAKHGSGFTLWPTSTHNYNISRSPWKDGKGDIVADFVKSCRKYGIKPGIYANMATNGYLWVDNPGLVQPGSPITQEEYGDIIMRQLTELWGNYGPLFEVWFDGGILSPAQGGADVLSLLRKLQPEAVAFQGPYGYENLIRWVGNEVGTAPDPCWATADSTTNSDGVLVVNGLHGRPDAPFWCPGESDFTLRRQSSFGGGWMWHEGEDDQLYSLDELMEKYETSVGRNTNMLLGLVIDNRGLIPDADVKRAEEYGEAIRRRYGSPVATTSGKGSELSLKFPSEMTVDRVVLQEEISEGERVLAWHLEGVKPDGSSVRLCDGTNIGHKQIAKFDPEELVSLLLVIDSCKADPVIRNFSVYLW